MTRKTKISGKISDLGEFGLIKQIAEKAHRSPSIAIGIGDDAAAFQCRPNRLALVTADMLVEGIHFDRSFCAPHELGRKSLAVNLSDIAAMGGHPRSFLLSLAVPETIPLDFIQDFTSGILEMAEEFGVDLIGGDTCASKSGLIIAITLYGEQEEKKIVRRCSARSGNEIFVTGYPGDSALGLKLLREGMQKGDAVRKHLDPTPRVREGRALAESELPSAMIDISDGLLSDLTHITENSCVGARLYLERIPLSGEYARHFRTKDHEAYSLALGGGEDYELLFTAHPCKRSEIESLFKRFGTPVSAIGEITDVPGIRILSPEGEIFPCTTGYDHFSPPQGEPA